jgi:hypothetical protein
MALERIGLVAALTLIAVSAVAGTAATTGTPFSNTPLIATKRYGLLA